MKDLWYAMAYSKNQIRSACSHCGYIYKESLFLSTHLSCEISLGAFVGGVCEHLRRLVIFY